MIAFDILTLSDDRMNTIGFSSRSTHKIQSFDEAKSLLNAPEINTEKTTWRLNFILEHTEK